MTEGRSIALLDADPDLGQLLTQDQREEARRVLSVRYHAVEALGKLRATEAVEALAEIAESRDFFLAYPAIDANAPDRNSVSAETSETPRGSAEPQSPY